MVSYTLEILSICRKILKLWLTIFWTLFIKGLIIQTLEYWPTLIENWSGQLSEKKTTQIESDLLTDVTFLNKMFGYQEGLVLIKWFKKLFKARNADDSFCCYCCTVSFFLFVSKFSVIFFFDFFISFEPEVILGPRILSHYWYFWFWRFFLHFN